MVRQKKIPVVFGSDDKPDASKERVPKELLQRYQLIVDKTSLSEDAKAFLMQRAAARGIQAMYADSKENASQSDEFKTFAQELEKKQESDIKFSHLDKRFDREAISTSDETQKYGKPIDKTDKFGL